MWREHPLTGVGPEGLPRTPRRARLAGPVLGQRHGGRGRGLPQAAAALPAQHVPADPRRAGPDRAARAGGQLAGPAAVRGCARLGRVRRARAPGLDCGLVACGLLVWQLTDFAYADIGGPSTVLTAVCFGLVAWWALAGDGTRDTSGGPPVPAYAEKAAGAMSGDAFKDHPRGRGDRPAGPQRGRHRTRPRHPRVPRQGRPRHRRPLDRRGPARARAATRRWRGCSGPGARRTRSWWRGPCRSSPPRCSSRTGWPSC